MAALVGALSEKTELRWKSWVGLHHRVLGAGKECGFIPNAV